MRLTYCTALAVGLFALVGIAGCSPRHVSSVNTAEGGQPRGATASVAVDSTGTGPSAAGSTGAAGSAAAVPRGNPDAASSPGVTSSGGANRQGENPEENLGNDVLIYVTDVTKDRPPKGTVIRLGKSEFQPDVRRVMDRGTLGPLRAGSTATLLVFPDGPKGKKVSIKIRAPRSGNSDPQSRILEVVLGDKSVRVVGGMVSPSSSGEHARF